MNIRAFAATIFCAAGLIAMADASARPPVWGITIVAPWGPETANAADPSISSDIIAEIGRRVDQPFALLAEPYARVLQNIRDNRVDFGLVFRSPNAEAYSVYPVCLFSVPIVAIARQGIAVTNLADLRALSLGIGIIRGVDYGAAFQDDPAIIKSIESDFPQMLRKLLAGRLDGVAGSTVMLMHHSRLTGARAMLGDRVPLTTTEVCIQVPKSRAETPMTQAVTQAARTMIAEGVPEEIVTRYVGFGW